MAAGAGAASLPYKVPPLHANRAARLCAAAADTLRCARQRVRTGSRSDCSPSTAILIHSFPKTVQRHSIYEDYAVVWDVSLGTGINGSVV